MAERRMFAKTIIDSDAFIDMPVTARLLYYDLAMRADDDGFVNSPKKIMRMIGASQDDLSILILRKFIIPFENGVVVIKHWRIHNYIRKDMYHETKYKEEKALLTTDENNAYTLSVTNPLQVCDETVTNQSTQVRLGKVRLGKDRKESDVSDKPKHSVRFVPPTFDEVNAYCIERQNGIDAQAFIDFYESKGWMIGKDKMKSWKAAVRTWENRRKAENPKKEVNQYDGYGAEFEV
ncbi:MAG: replisome organizer [Clostridiales bacterium]|nr:replisome organizer [Clostridiales bacterium]